MHAGRGASIPLLMQNKEVESILSSLLADAKAAGALPKCLETRLPTRRVDPYELKLIVTTM